KVRDTDSSEIAVAARCAVLPCGRPIAATAGATAGAAEWTRAARRGLRFGASRLQAFYHRTLQSAAGQALDTHQLRPILCADQRNGRTGIAATAGAADAMNVIFGRVWQIIID